MTSCDNQKKQVIKACLWLSEHGYFGSVRGSGGNVSVRLCHSGNTMAITPSSVRYQEMNAEDICVVGLDGKPIEIKEGLKPSIETGLHGIVYQMRPDVNAVVHTHQIYGSVFGVLNIPIPPLFDEVSLALGPTVEMIPYALSGSPELAANVGTKLSNNANAYIIQNHGILALGKNLEKAILHAELLEKLAHTYCLALSTGKSISTLPAATTNFAAAMREMEVREAQKKV